MSEGPKNRVQLSMLMGILTMVLILGMGIAGIASKSAADVLSVVFIVALGVIFALIYFGELLKLSVVTEYFIKGRPLREVFLPAVPGLIAIVVIVVGLQLWHTTLSSKARTGKRMDRLFTAIDSFRQSGDKLPKEDELSTALDVRGSDPHNLSSFYNNDKDEFADTWGRKIVYKRGSLSLFSLRSYGPNGVEDSRLVDDIVRGDLIVVNLNPKDKIIDGVKGLLSRDKDDEEKPKDTDSD